MAPRRDLDPVGDRSPLLCRFFGHVMQRQLRRSFHAVRISRSGLPSLPPGRPAIVYTNHPSWWDPALFILLASTRFQARPCYGPMDAAALEKYRFMRRIGIFGIEPGSRRGAATFLRTGLRILEDADAMLWVTVEGTFTDPRARPPRLEPGVAHLIARAPHAVAVALAIEYPFWDERYPEALCRFGPTLQGDPARNAGDWQHRLTAELEASMDELASEAMRRDAGLFELVVRGAAGVGGTYDAWRWLRARAAGERFRAEHGGPEV